MNAYSTLIVTPIPHPSQRYRLLRRRTDNPLSVRLYIDDYFPTSSNLHIYDGTGKYIYGTTYRVSLASAFVTHGTPLLPFLLFHILNYNLATRAAIIKEILS